MKPLGFERLTGHYAVCKFPVYTHRLVYAADRALDKKCFNIPMRIKLPLSFYDYPFVY
jgi:hypothetical protein